MEKYRLKEFLTDILFDIIGGLLFSAGIYTFAYNADFAPGGVSGISIIINHFTELPIGTLSLILNIPIILVSLRYLGKKFFFRSAKSMVISALFLDLLFPHLPTYNGNELLAALFAGALAGAGLGLVYMRGSSTGGVDFLIFSIKKKYPHMSVGEITIFLDGLVILTGAVVFKRIDSALYGVVMTVVSTVVIDKIMNGAVIGKLAFIITDNAEGVAAAISDSTDRGSTIFHGKGAYTGQDRKMVLCACSKSEIAHVRRSVYATDKSAFVMITDYSETFGEGFQEPESHS